MIDTATTSTALAVAKQVVNFAGEIAAAVGVPFAAVASAIADLIIDVVGTDVMAQKIDGWKIAEAQADALADAKFGPEAK